MTKKNTKTAPAKASKPAAAPAITDEAVQPEAEVTTPAVTETPAVPAAPKEVTYKVRVVRNFYYINGRFQEKGKVLTLTAQQFANSGDAVELVK